MKKWLLSICCVFSLSWMTAQTTTFWSEDFADGLKGWTVQTSRCGIIAGPNIGVWNLTSVTFDGNPVSGVTGELDVISTQEYSATIMVGGTESHVQAGYTSANNTITSNLNGVTLTTGSLAYGNNTLQTLWYTDINLGGSDLNSWGTTAFGIGDPVYAVNGTDMTLTSGDGLTVLTYEKVADCGKLWRWSHNGGVGVGIFAPDALAITSPSTANGSVQVNCDYLSTLGIPGNVPSGPPYPQYITELISPVIDLSGVTEAVSVRFYELVRVLNLATGAPQDANGSGARTSFAYSTDGGMTWSDAVNANDGVAVNAAPLNVQREFPVPGLQGHDNVRLKFTVALDFYYWALDDIAIVSRVPYDMQANRNFFSVVPNYSTPISQVEAVGFIADIQNNGGRTATNVELNLSIRNNETTNVIYNSTNEYGDIPADQDRQNHIFTELLDPNALEIGTYRGRYLVSHDSMDLNTTNDTIYWNFVVSDSLFSKEAGSTRNVAPADEPTYTYGNCFFLPHGDGYYARYVTFGVSNAADLIGRSLTTYLYKWDGDLNEDGQANPDEYGGAPIAFNAYVFDGSENNLLLTIPVDLDETAIPLEDNYYYIMAVQYVSTDDQDCFLLASTAIDYNAMWYGNDSLEMPRYGSMLEVGNPDAPDLSQVGFGWEFIPVVRLSVGNNPDLHGPANMEVSVQETVVPENLATIYPNPAGDRFNVKLDLAQQSDVRVSVIQTDGKVVLVRDYENMQRESLVFDARQLAAGQYFVKISTEAGTNVKPLIIKR